MIARDIDVLTNHALFLFRRYYGKSIEDYRSEHPSKAYDTGFCRSIPFLCEWAMVNTPWSDVEVRELFELHKKIVLAAAPHDFECYLLYVEWDREPEKKFYLPRRSVLKEVVDAMQDLLDDKLDLLTISMPPGTGKSTLGIFFLSMVMGKYPDNPNLASAHSGLLTRSLFDGAL